MSMSLNLRSAEDQRQFEAWRERMKRKRERARALKRVVITAEDGVAILAVYQRRKQQASAP